MPARRAVIAYLFAQAAVLGLIGMPTAAWACAALAFVVIALPANTHG
jgi:hypothetical protein